MEITELFNSLEVLLREIVGEGVEVASGLLKGLKRLKMNTNTSTPSTFLTVHNEMEQQLQPLQP